MPSYTLDGIVTRYADYKDYDRILTILTADMGMVSAKARGCRRPKSPLMGAAELFVYGEFVLYKSNDKYTLDSCEVKETFYPLREDISRFGAGAYMLSIVNEGATEGERADAMLSLLLYSLSYTAYTQNDPADMAICFAARCLNLMGYKPAITRCAVCGLDIRREASMPFSDKYGGVLCPSCARAIDEPCMRLSALSLEALRRMLLLSDEDIKKVALPIDVRRELKTAVNDYAEYVLEKKLKAFDCI